MVPAPIEASHAAAIADADHRTGNTTVSAENIKSFFSIFIYLACLR
jgi:hypothetical protein